MPSRLRQPSQSSSAPNTPLCVVSIGECMVELTPSADSDSLRFGFAGDTYNTAWYLRTIQNDWNVRYMTVIGDDAISNRMLAGMHDHGIDTAFIRCDPQRTVGLYLISLNNGERSFSYWRGQSAARRLAQDPADLLRAMEGASLVYLSGITMAILDPVGRANLLECLSQARESGSLVAFDPNLRPALWEDAETMRDIVSRTAACSDIDLPSFEDEATHFGDATPEATLSRYFSEACQTVIVKNGPDDVLYREGVAQGRVPTIPARDLVDTTSAGDSFNAGVLSRLLMDEDMEAAIRGGSAIAAKVIGQRGALVPLDLASGGKSMPH